MALFQEYPSNPSDRPFSASDVKDHSASFTLPPQAMDHGLGLDHNPNVPEPSSYALVFGACLLAFSISRKLYVSKRNC